MEQTTAQNWSIQRTAQPPRRLEKNSHFLHAPNHFDDLRPLEWNTASHEDVQMKEETVFCSEVLRPYLGREWFGLMIGRKKS